MTNIISISTGSGPNKGDGESLKSAFHYVNLNFKAVTDAIDVITSTNASPPNLGDIVITDNIISTAITNQDIILNPNGIGDVGFANTKVRFDWTGGNTAQGKQIINTRGNGTDVGLGIDNVNYSLRIVGDKDNVGTLVDMGLYNGTLGAWDSKVYIDYHGNIRTAGNLVINKGFTATGLITALSGVKFPDGSTQATAVSQLTLSEITSGTISNEILNVSALRFDRNSGFQLTDLGDGEVEVGMNSTFKYWEVDGQSTLIAEGLDYVRFEAGNGITITTDPNATVKTISFSVSENVNTGTVNLGLLAVDETTIYSTTSSLGAALGNSDVRETTDGASYILFPSTQDIISPLIISSPNEVRLTTAADSTNPLTVAPNIDGTGPGYVVIGAGSTTSTSGLFAYSAAAEINFWPNPTIAYLANGNNPDVGTLDLYTYDDNDISIRPNGTGTTVITSNLEIRKSLVFSSANPGSGAAGANSGDYQTAATLLNINKQIQKLNSGDYYLPPGVEGQMMYFVPKTNADNTVRIWFQNYRSMDGMNTTEHANAQWTPFSSSLSFQGPVYAIYIDNAWTTSHAKTS